MHKIYPFNDRLVDLLLIKKIKANDDHGIRQLFNKYLPLVKSLYAAYPLRGLDLDDWKQESVIVMLKCARSYQFKRALRFGTLYQRSLHNRLVDLIRRQHAQRRVPVRSLTSLEANEIFYANTLRDRRIPCPEGSILMNERLKAVLQICSPLEKTVLFGTLNRLTMKSIALRSGNSLGRVRRAFGRCQRKFRKLR